MPVSDVKRKARRSMSVLFQLQVAGKTPMKQLNGDLPSRAEYGSLWTTSRMREVRSRPVHSAPHAGVGTHGGSVAHSQSWVSNPQELELFYTRHSLKIS